MWEEGEQRGIGDDVVQDGVAGEELGWLACGELYAMLGEGRMEGSEEGSGFKVGGRLIVRGQEKWADNIAGGVHVLAYEGEGTLVFVIGGGSGEC